MSQRCLSWGFGVLIVRVCQDLDVSKMCSFIQKAGHNIVFLGRIMVSDQKITFCILFLEHLVISGFYKILHLAVMVYSLIEEGMLLFQFIELRLW